VSNVIKVRVCLVFAHNTNKRPIRDEKQQSQRESIINLSVKKVVTHNSVSIGCYGDSYHHKVNICGITLHEAISEAARNRGVSFEVTCVRLQDGLDKLTEVSEISQEVR